MKRIEEAFEFCPQCGQRSTTFVSSNPFRCSSCEFVFYFSPTAAVGGIVTHEDKILFLVRGKDPGRGKYGLPGGFADPGETLEESLRREVFEEASLQVAEMSYLCSYPNQYPYRGVTVEVLDTFFECRVDSFDSMSAQAGEVAELCWLVPDEKTLDKLAFHSNRLAILFYLQQQATS
ncbi:MAG: NUDIX domain-containing protein [Planctomycetota bacterium]